MQTHLQINKDQYTPCWLQLWRFRSRRLASSAHTGEVASRTKYCISTSVSFYCSDLPLNLGKIGFPANDSSVRDTLANSKEWLDSASYQKFLGAIKPLSMGAIAIRHAYLHEYNAGCKALARGSPFTGTVYYLAPDRKAWDLAWARWQTIISKVPGFMGISGGPVVEEVDGHATSFLVFVGWESVEAHDAYHHTEEFRRLRGVLIGPTKGYAYYGHVKFQNEETGDLRSEVKVKEAKL